MSRSWAVLFSGQGAQHADMLAWLDPQHGLLQQMQAMLGVADWRAAMQQPGWAVQNRVAQVLLTATGLAAWAAIAPGLPPPAVAGYSVGELAAFSAAGVCAPADAVDWALRRAEAMDRCAAQQPGGLVGVSGLPADGIARLCERHGCSVAIRLAADAVVLGGPLAALAAAQAQAAQHGARVTPLPVGVASHTPAMQPAADDLAALLQQAGLRAPALALYANAEGDAVRDEQTAARVLAAQVARTVAWDTCLDALAAHQPACVLEIGPGAALAGQWNRRLADAPARSADEFRSLGALRAWVQRRLDA